MTHSVPPEELARSAATLARSSAITNALKWVALVVVYPGLVGVITWAAAKLDTQHDLATIRLDLTQLVTQQQQTTARVDALIASVQPQINGLQRDIVVSTGAALAYESERRSKDKLEAGGKLAAKYDEQLARLVPSATASANVIANASGLLPHTAR